MPHFMIVLMLYINLLSLSWIKISIFEEYGAFNLLYCFYVSCLMYKYVLMYLRPNSQHFSQYGLRHAKKSSSICGQQRPGSACASAQSDQGLHIPLTESFDTIKCIHGKQMLG